MVPDPNVERRVTRVCKELFKAVGIRNAKVREGVREIAARLK